MFSNNDRIPLIYSDPTYLDLYGIIGAFINTVRSRIGYNKRRFNNKLAKVRITIK